MYVPQLDKNRRIHIYVPDEYEKSGEKYPVLYMFDGHNLFEDSEATYGKSWNLANKIKETGKDLIVVGIECSHEGNQRLAEYTPFPYADSDFDLLVNALGKETMDFIVDTLKPYIDKRFPTKPEREFTWIGGSSCGGSMALFAIQDYNKYFAKAICLSPFIRPYYDYMLINAWHTQIEEPTSLYISWGALEGPGKHAFIQETIMITEIANGLMEHGVNVRFHVKEEGMHCEADWEQEAPVYLKFLMN